MTDLSRPAIGTAFYSCIVLRYLLMPHQWQRWQVSDFANKDYHQPCRWHQEPSTDLCPPHIHQVRCLSLSRLTSYCRLWCKNTELREDTKALWLKKETRNIRLRVFCIWLQNGDIRISNYTVANYPFINSFLYYPSRTISDLAIQG